MRVELATWATETKVCVLVSSDAFCAKEQMALYNYNVSGASFSSPAASAAVPEAAPAICRLDLLFVLYPSRAILTILGRTRVPLLTCPYSGYAVVDHHLIVSLMYV